MIPLLDLTQLVTTFCSSAVLALVLLLFGVTADCWEAFLLDGVLVGVFGVTGGPA